MDTVSPPVAMGTTSETSSSPSTRLRTPSPIHKTRSPPANSATSNNNNNNNNVSPKNSGRSPPQTPTSGGGGGVSPKRSAQQTSQQQPQQRPRKRIRSELDRLLSDEGTKILLRGLGKKQTGKKKKLPGGTPGAGPASGLVIEARKRRAAATVVVPNTRKSSSVAISTTTSTHANTTTPVRSRNGSVSELVGVKRERSSTTPARSRQATTSNSNHSNNNNNTSVTNTSDARITKVDPKFVNVSRRGNVAWVTVVCGGTGHSLVDRGIDAEKGGGGGGGGHPGGGPGSMCPPPPTPKQERHHHHHLSSAAAIVNNGAFGLKVLQSLECAFRTLETEDKIDAIVLQNNHSRFFCRGIDLNELVLPMPTSSSSSNINKTNSINHHGNDKNSNSTSHQRLSLIAKAVKSLIQTLSQSEKILVASVSGDCVGLGCMILPLFDFVYANDKSNLRLHYNALGQQPEGLAVLLLHHKGAVAIANKVTSLLYLNTPLTATEAESCGLVTEVLWPACYNEHLCARLQAISTNSAIIRATKRTVMAQQPQPQPQHQRLPKLLDNELNAIEQTWRTTEFQERVRAFLGGGGGGKGRSGSGVGLSNGDGNNVVTAAPAASGKSG